MSVFRKIAMLVAAAALLVGPGCASAQKRAPGGAASPGSQAPKPKLSATATGLKLSTNTVAAPSATPAKAPAAPAKQAATPPAQGAAASKPQASPRDETRAAYRLRGGDSVVIFLRGIPPKDDELQDILDESGSVNLPYIGNINASGKTTSELEQEIEKAYLDQKIYKNISVSVVLPAQYFFVRGEVKMAGRFPLVPGTTLLQAIAAAGGYNDYADTRSVKVIRGERALQFDAKDLERHPDKDVVLEPGDVVVVPRSLF